MNGQQVWRRMVLGAFTVALALPGLGAAATVDDGGHDSAGQFKGFCEENGGTFIDTEDGNLWCQYADGSQEVCDADGQDCSGIPKHSNHQGPFAGPGGVATDEGSTDAPAPGVNIPTTSGAQSSVSAPDVDQDKGTSKGKKSRKGKKGGKGRNK